MYSEPLTILVPILINFSLSVVNDQCFIFLVEQCFLENFQGYTSTQELKSYLVISKITALKARPVNGVLLFLSIAPSEMIIIANSLP
jgi:hypothetical protein